MSAQSEIERLSARRSALWAGAPEAEPQEAERIGKQLANLYEELRHKRALAASGRNRAQALYRARVESELERLMTR